MKSLSFVNIGYFR